MRLFEIIAISLIASASPAQAQGWTAELTITAAFTENSEALVVHTDGQAYVPACVSGSWVITAGTDPRKDRMWATVMTAFGAGKKIRLWFSGACGAFNYHEATAVMIVS